MTITSRENATNVSAGRVRPFVAAVAYGALQVLCMLAVLAANAVLLHVVSPESTGEVALVLVVAVLSLAAFPFLVRAARRRLPAARTPGTVAAEIAGTLLAMLLPALLLFAAGRADAQQMQVGDGRVEMGGGQVRVGDGCAKVGNLEVGGCQEHGKDLPEASGEERPGEETDGSTTPETTTTGTPPTREVAGCPVDGPPGDALAATVERVVDGDTFEISGDIQGADKVRLIGVDAPETVAPDEDDEPFGEEASAFTREALEGEEVLLEPGEDPEDQYGRLLAYAWKGKELFNATLVEGGYAEALAVDPNTRYRECFEAAEREAKRDGRGLWGVAPGSEDIGDDPTAAEDQYAPPDGGGEETTAPASEPSGSGGEGPWGLLRDLIGGMSGDGPGPDTTVLERTVVQRQAEEQVQESTGGGFGQELTETDAADGTSPRSATPDDVSSASPDDLAFGLQPVGDSIPTATASPGAGDFQYGPEAPTATPTPNPQDTLTVLPDTGGPFLRRLMLLLPAGIALLVGGSVVLGILYKTEPHAGEDEDRG